MRRAALIAALAAALPVAGTLGQIAYNEAALAGASEWRIPITGYDPRDPLRGRYIAFQYSWRAEGDVARCGRDEGCTLCLEEGGAKVRAAPKGATCPSAIDPEASGLSVVAMARAGGQGATASTRVWVSEVRAPELEAQLRNRPMVAVARLTRGGRLLADRLEPDR